MSTQLWTLRCPPKSKERTRPTTPYRSSGSRSACENTVPLPWREAINDDLRAALYACKSILTKLQLIDDAPASRLREGPRGPRYATSRIPEGVRTNGNSLANHAPSKQFSLWAHYSWRMERAAQAQNVSELLKLAACAARDHDIHMGRHAVNQHGSHEAAVIELLRDHTGVRAVDVSWYLNVAEKWVRRHRVLNGRDAEYGEPRETDARTQKIVRMKAAGATTKAIAEEVGVSTGYVSNVVNGKAAAA